MRSVQVIYRDGVLVPQEPLPSELKDGIEAEVIVISSNTERNGAALNGKNLSEKKQTPAEIHREILDKIAGDLELSQHEDPFPGKSHDEVLYGDAYRPYGA